MDAEITAAKNANIGYWAFLRYTSDPTMNLGYDLYQTSSIKAQVPYCWMVELNYFGSTGSYSAQVAEIALRMQDAHWRKVLTDRPLIYVYWNDAQYASNWASSMTNLKAAIDALRAAVTGAGLGTPYIVAVHGFSTLSFSAQKTGIGADAVTAYISETLPNALKASYTSLASATAGFWATMAASASTVVPIVMTGWDRRPRIQRPVQWEVSRQFPQIGHNSYVIPPTPAELTTHVAAAKSYIAANPSVCPADTALIYAWNEFDEGGAICPSQDGKGQALLAAIAATLAP
jgi:hypothetical protein